MRAFIAIIFVLSIRLGLSQEGQFSQYFAAPAYLNPAYVGLENSRSLSLNYKNSGTSSEGSYNEMMHASIIYPLQKVNTIVSKKAGVGLTFVSQRTGIGGIYHTTQVLATGSYIVPFDVQSKAVLSFGLQGGVIQSRLNTSDLHFGTQYNPYIGYDDTLPTEPFNTESKINPVFNFGALISITEHHNPLLSRNSFAFGASFHNLNNPREGFIDHGKRPISLKGVFTSRFKLASLYFIHPTGYIQKTKSLTQVNNGVYVSRYIGKELTTTVQLGTWYRYGDSFIFLVGMSHKQYRVGVSMDLNASSFNPNNVALQGGSTAAFEFSFRYDLNFKKHVFHVSSPLF